jgi:hypothetical protein
MRHPVRFLHLGGHDLLTDVIDPGVPLAPSERPFPAIRLGVPGQF